MVNGLTKGKLNRTRGKTGEKSIKLVVKKSLKITGKAEYAPGTVQVKNGSSNSSYDMLSWQLKTLLGQIQQIEMHESGDCPCILNTQDPPERCLGNGEYEQPE